jgi:rhodanese-related sulfurtransferase
VGLSRVVVCLLVIAGVALTPRGALAARPAPTPSSPTPPDTLPIARMGIPQAMLATERGEIVLVDVRPAVLRALGHIRGDVSAPLDRVAAASRDLPRDRRLVFYCACPAEELALDAARTVLESRKDARVAVLVGGYDGWRAAGGPIQMDASWEQAFHAADPPAAGWGKTPIDTLRCRYDVDSTTAARGRWSGRITCVPDTAAWGFAGFTQRLDADRLRGRRVTLSAMVRSQDVARAAFLWIGAEDADGRIIYRTPPDADPFVGTHDWRLSVISGDIPPNAAKVLIGISLLTSGRVWLDDVHLVAPETLGLPRFRALVENGSFEE